MIGYCQYRLKVASFSSLMLATPMATVATIGLFGITAGKSLGAWQKFSSSMKGIWKDLSKGTDEAFGAIYKAFQAGDLIRAVSLSWETIKTIWTNGITVIANKLDEMKVGTQNTLDALRTDFFNLGHEIGKFFDGVAVAIAKTMYKAGNIAKAMTPLSGMNMHQAKLLNANADGKFQRSGAFDRLIAENDERLTGRIGERDRALRERQGTRLASAEAQREKLALLTDEQVKERRKSRVELPGRTAEAALAARFRRLGMFLRPVRYRRASLLDLELGSGIMLRISQRRSKGFWTIRKGRRGIRLI